tara:strand:+ start:972 stop:1613 length:642 start_codon:yes stop_codon:yes gene_type:complete
MLLTEREIKNIIEEEIITILIEEGFLQDLGKKAGKAMLPLAMAAGLSGMAGTAQASPNLQSTETPIAQVALSPTSQKISKELKKLGQNVSPDDVNELGQLVDKLDSSDSRLISALVRAIDSSLKRGKDKDAAIARVQKKLNAAVNGPKMKILNAVLGYGMKPGRETANELGDAIVAAVKGGNISKADGMKIFDLAKDPAGNLDKIQALLGLQN